MRENYGTAVASSEICLSTLHFVSQRFMLGYEFPDTIMLLAGGTLYVHATAKKRECAALVSAPITTPNASPL